MTKNRKKENDELSIPRLLDEETGLITMNLGGSMFYGKLFEVKAADIEQFVGNAYQRHIDEHELFYNQVISPANIYILNMPIQLTAQRENAMRMRERALDAYREGDDNSYKVYEHWNGIISDFDRLERTVNVQEFYVMVFGFTKKELEKLDLVRFTKGLINLEDVYAQKIKRLLFKLNNQNVKIF